MSKDLHISDLKLYLSLGRKWLYKVFFQKTFVRGKSNVKQYLTVSH